jgi:hypothetical protein
LIETDLAYKHYNDKKVCNEIAKFARNRWVGIHCLVKGKRGRYILKRYVGKFKKPITINEPNDVLILLKKLAKLKPRTFYATTNLYKKVKFFENVFDYSNILACTPTWDIDNSLNDWEITILLTKEILSLLESFGVKKSVFVKWSGNGCHIHLHQKSISQEIFKKINPLDVSYSIVEFIITKLKDKIVKFQMKSKDLVVENKIDIQRLFTCPLSLHRELNRVCVCIEPNRLDSFSLDWTLPNKFIHYYNWDSYEIGEADELVEKAYFAIGPCPYYGKKRRLRKYPSLDEQIMKYL